MLNFNLEKTVKEFNHSDTGLVVSSWPSRIKGSKFSGVSVFTKETVVAEAKKYNKKIVVLSENNYDNRPVLLASGKVLVLRVFDHKHPRLYPTILKYLSRFSKIRSVTVHSEFCAGGDLKNFALLPPFLALIRLAGRKVNYIAHNVVIDFQEIAPHFNIPQKSLRAKVIKRLMKVYNLLLGLVCNKIIVLSPVLEKRLEQIVRRDKIAALFFPNYNQKKGKVTKLESRKRLGIKKNKKVILYFGFLTWYKGADWLVKSFDKLSKSSKYKSFELIMGGGPSYSLQDKKYYQNYYKKIENIAKKNKQIKITGFLPENKVEDYFNSADIVVLPYRTAIGASACLSQAFDFEKPFILSKKLSQFISTVFAKDYKNLTFARNINAFQNSLDYAFENLNEAEKISLALKRKFNMNSWLNEYEKAIKQN